MAGAELKLNNITKTFKAGRRGFIIAVDHVSLVVPGGKLVTLLGPSGCGKTTTLRIVGGFELPDEGEVYIDGKNVTFLPPQQRPTATVFQSYALFPHMTVFQNVAYGLKVRRLHRKEIQKRVKEALSLVGLTELGDRMPHQLSGGQQQRVALARVLAIQPRVILFDEPLSNLDAKLRVETRVQVRRLQQDMQITSLYVTHDQSEAMAISDYVAVMDKGRIQQFGTPREIYLEPSNKFVADFIGEANFVKAIVIEINERDMTCALEGGVKVRVKKRRDVGIGDKGYVVIRPEYIKLVNIQDGNLTGQITFVEVTGSTVTYSIRLPSDESIKVKTLGWTEESILPEGMSVGLKIITDAIHFVKD